MANISTIRASHFSNVGMWYECLNGCTYRIYYSIYYDCAGAAINGYMPPNISNPYPSMLGQSSITGTGCNINSFPTPWTPYSFNEITPICPSVNTYCSGTGAGLVNGIAEGVYYNDINVCGLGCTSLTITFSNCCRSYSITSGAAGDAIYHQMTIPINSAIGCNSSPKFIEPPVTYIPQGQTTIIQQTAYDSDGDSLVYSLIPCQAGAGVTVGYAPGYSYLAPLGATWNVSINSQTGEMTFTPNTTGNIVVGLVNVKVEEYRNNTLIGSISREMMVTVVNSGANTHPTANINNVNGASQLSTPDRFYVAPNYPVSFDINVSDANITDTLSFASNLLTNLPTASLTGITGTNPMTLHFNWTPTLADIGKTFSFILDAKDSHCPIRGDYYHLFRFDVGADTMSAIVLPSVCGGATGNIDFTMGGGVTPYNYLWNNGATTEDLTNIPVGTYWNTITDATGAIWYSDTFYVNSNNLLSTFTLTSPSCNVADGQIDITTSGGQAPYSYVWSNGQTGATIGNLAVGGYSVDVQDALGCTAHEVTLLDYDPLDSCFSIISGRIYFDVNQNCVQDVNEASVPNVFVDITPGGAVLTDANGDYTFVVNNTGNYVIQCVFNPNTPATVTCAPFSLTKNVLISALGVDSVGNNFGIALTPDIKTYLNQGTYNSGFSHQGHILAYNASYYNVPNPTISYQHDSILLNPSFVPAPTSYNAATHTATWNLTNFYAGNLVWINIYGTTSATAVAGDTVRSYVNIMPVLGDSYPQNNYDTTICIVNASYDPNKKVVFPQGEGIQGLIAPTTPKLEYQLNFQNTGNFPAQFVILRDTIDVNNLVINSIEMQGSSHACSVSIEEDSILVFTFANINLPDSTSDEPHSHGMVQFGINLKPNLSLDTRIENSVSIYFDFNAPVKTNTVVNTLYAPMQLSVNVDSSVCSNDFATANVLFGKAPYSFIWSNGTQISGNTTGTSQIPANFSAGAQSVQVTDAYGKSITNTFNINLEPTANAGFSYYHIGNDYGFVADSTNNATYFWSFGNGQTSNLMNPFVTYTQSGVYLVYLITTDNCGEIDTSAQHVSVIISGIDAAFAHSAKLSPNPFDATSTLSFENPENEVYELVIRDLSGKVVQRIENIRVSEVKIERGEKAAGTYLWELKGKKQAQGLMLIE